MSNFQCSQCGMVNIDCGKKGYKTPKELKYEKTLEEIEREIIAMHYVTILFHQGITHGLADIVQEYKNKILDIISKAKESV